MTSERRTKKGGRRILTRASVREGKNVEVCAGVDMVVKMSHNLSPLF